jgi:hypothetical protein
MADVDAEIRDVFDDISRAIPGMSVKPYPATSGKLGVRFEGEQVVLTYNSYRRGWLDTTADLGPELRRWFGFQPTHNKPDQYWAVKLAPEKVQTIYREHREDSLTTLRGAHGVCASAPAGREAPRNVENPVASHSEPPPAAPTPSTVSAPSAVPESVRKCFLSVFQCSRCADCARRFPELDTAFPPQPGFVGARYGAASPRIVLLAQNPGHASRASHSPDEARMYALWKTAAETKTDDGFGACMAFLREFMESWPIIEKAKLRERFALSLDDVAYFNILKCKTKENRQPSTGLYETCAQQTTRRQLAALSPGYVLCFGKAVFEQVEPTLRSVALAIGAAAEPPRNRRYCSGKAGTCLG